MACVGIRLIEASARNWAPMDLADLQNTIRATYGERDRERGLPRTFAWFVEEVGELSRALFREDLEARSRECADVLAWLVTVADLAGVDLDAAARRYEHGCPKCASQPCVCGQERAAGSAPD